MDTRRRVLDAAIRCLATHGYPATTTTLVCAQAGVSRGALLYHFPSRQQLVGAAVGHLFEELREEFQRGFARLSPRGNRLNAAIDLLSTIFQDNRLTAVLELWLAARTDAELRSQLLPVSQQHQDHIRELARRYFPELAAVPRFEVVLNLLIDALQGAAVRAIGNPQEASLRQTQNLLKTVASSILSQAKQGAPS